jgi:hypothetical protein
MAIGDGDLDLMFDTDDFAVVATFDSTPDIVINAIFNGPTDQTTMYGQIQIEAQSPSLICKTSEVANVANGMSVSVDGQSGTFTVIRKEKTGVGFTVVYLKS